MKYQIFLLAIATLLAPICAEEEPEAAKLLVAKQILNKYLVENMDIIVKVINNHHFKIKVERKRNKIVIFFSCF